jgi:hypothetical protein
MGLYAKKMIDVDGGNVVYLFRHGKSELPVFVLNNQDVEILIQTLQTTQTEMVSLTTNISEQMAMIRFTK